jgi:hypothetical protein
MAGYAAEIAGKRQRFFGRLSEQDRRRYAAGEAAKRGHGGGEYIARLLAGAPKTIRQGLHELEEAEDAAAGRLSAKKGGAPAARRRPEKRPAAPWCRSARPAIRGVQASWGRTCRGVRCHDA